MQLSALQVSTGSSGKKRVYRASKTHDASRWPIIPINGTASDVVGIFSATRLRNTVNESSMVTPEMKICNFECVRLVSLFVSFANTREHLTG